MCKQNKNIDFIQQFFSCSSHLQRCAAIVEKVSQCMRLLLVHVTTAAPCACVVYMKQKPASLMVWVCISAYGMGSFHVLEGTMNTERYIKDLEQHMLPSRGRVFQQDNAKPHTAAITTAWLRSTLHLHLHLII